jgi:hypothetical protein
MRQQRQNWLFCAPAPAANRQAPTFRVGDPRALPESDDAVVSLCA